MILVVVLAKHSQLAKFRGMPKIIGALLARNEAGEDRYLKRALDNAALFCDEIVVLDDGSTDATLAFCKDHSSV